jgi:hypothetical protein
MSDRKRSFVMISVGGFLGVDTKDVAAPFRAIHAHDEGQQVVVGHEYHEGCTKDRARL